MLSCTNNNWFVGNTGAQKRLPGLVLEKKKNFSCSFVFECLLFEGKVETSDLSTVFAKRKELLGRANSRELNFQIKVQFP